MKPETTHSGPSLLGQPIHLPQHVVYRSFPAETVVLNLQTGKYHGLNPSAGRMLEAVERAGSVGAAAAKVAAEFEQPQAVIERDMCDLCRLLLDRGLVEIGSRDAR
ncbi:MAG TPA: PqqD family protein [Solirubrobacterales bacterium]